MLHNTHGNRLVIYTHGNRLVIYLFTAIQTLSLTNRHDRDRGQSTAEYALLLLGAATIALIVVTWATGTGKIAELFDAVVDSIIGKV
jgi:hypothetical protein